MGKCKITHVQQQTNHPTNPILIGWDHGILKEEMIPSADCTVQKEPGSTRYSSIQVNLGQGMVYEGHIDAKPLCKTFIAIRSRNKKKPTHSKVKLYEASSTLLVEQSKTTSLTSFENINRMDKFYKVFGSKQGFRQHESMKKMNIVQGNVRENLRKSLGMTKTEEDESISTPGEGVASSLHSILPPCDRSAAVKEDVYSVDSIIPEYILSELEEDAQYVAGCLKKSTPLSEEDYSSFFISNVSAIVKSSSVKIEPDELKHRVKLLIFCELLLKLINSRRDLERARFALIAKLPSTNQYILDNYAKYNGERRVLSTESQDKALCHVIILTLLACCYVFNVKTLCSSVAYSAEKLAPMLQLVGLTPAPNTDRRLYVLKTPLPPLPSGVGKRGGGVGMKRKRT